MTLHDAIEKLLKQNGYPMTTTEIANELNRNKWYQKRDGSPIIPYQIHGRTKNYSKHFNRNGSTVSLVGVASQTVSNTKNISTTEKTVRMSEVEYKPGLIEKVLMNEKNYKLAGNIDSLVPDTAGLYCIRIKNIQTIPEPFNSILTARKNNIIYLGIASQSLKKRLLNQELRAKGHGTFFRSIGAVLGFRPPKGSLKTKANKKNYKFKSSIEIKIIEWINSNLTVNWVTTDADLNNIESDLISKYTPLLNITKNPLALEELRELRALCVQIANS